MKLSETFEQAHAGYVPEPTDCPDAIPAYRTWRGFKAVLENHLPETMDKIGGAYSTFSHEILCSHAKTFQEAVRVAGFFEMSAPEEPHPHVRCTHEPDTSQQAIERQANQIFESSVRAKFPGIRKNSKDWKAKKEKVWSQAMNIARDQIEHEHAAYAAKEAAFLEREARERAAWLEGVHAVALIYDGIRDLQELARKENA